MLQPAIDDQSEWTMTLPTIEEQRARLRETVIEADRKHRMVYVGSFIEGPTGIIGSLHRALESLGHTVFALDPREHQAGFRNPEGARAGFGPIFFRPESFEALFRTFRPEVIIFAAGGVVLDESAAATLREQNILSIGVTLSDPDVQDSVIEWVDNFDYHATNAAFALERYLREGHPNTVLMPFGIDREYILREVPAAPELRADAICIGHAGGREERHRVMGALAESLDVRVYGNGWPMESEVVSGDRLLQAGREGAVHVNFPGTRAGFTNVKCGVFESVGVGAVLATNRFEEMGRLFEYDHEIIGYESAEDLAEQVLALKSAPDRLEQIRRRGFARLLSEHLYEHRWLQLFDAIRADLQENASSKPREEREALLAILERRHGRPRTVLISGYYGANNRGDDLLLRSIGDALRREDEDINVVVAAVDAPTVERVSGLQAFSRADPHESEKYAATATATVLGAGGLWHDYTIGKAGGVAGIVTNAQLSPAHLAQLPLMTRAYGGEFHVYGMGAGPLVDEAAKAAVRLTGGLARSVVVRDEESARLLAPLASSWAAEPEVAPDAVYALDLRREPFAGTLPERYIVLNVRPWQKNDEVHEHLRDSVLAEAWALGLPVVAVPMQPVDEHALLGKTGALRDEYAAVITNDVPSEQFFDVIANAAAVVSMRLHTNLLAHRFGVPALGFAYDPKVRVHFEELGRAEYALPLDSSRDRIAAALAAILDQADMPDEALERVRAQETAASSALERLAAQIAEAPLRVSPIAGMTHTPIVGSVKHAPSRPRRPRGSLGLSAAVVGGRNSRDPERVVEIERQTSKAGDTFRLAAGDAKKGDTAEWSLPLETEPGGAFRVEIVLKQRYPEKTNRRGRMAYVVSLGDTDLFRIDSADWNERNTVWIGFTAESDETRLRVRIEALRDLPDWSWGKVTAVTVEEARQLRWGSGEALVWGASSPFAQALAGAQSSRSRHGLQPAVAGAESSALPDRPARPSLARRIIRRVRRMLFRRRNKG